MTDKNKKSSDWRTKLLAGLTLVSSVVPGGMKAQSFENDDNNAPKTEVISQTPQTEETSLEDFRIGNLTLDYLSGLSRGSDTVGTRKITPIAKGTIRPFSSKDYTIEKIDDYKDGILAYQKGEHVTLYKANKEHKFKDVDAQEYAKGNPVAELSVFLHEIGHLNDFKNFAMGEEDNTPLNAVRFDRFTESKSIAIQYLTTADYYHKLKEQGVEVLQYKNNKGEQVSMSVDKILDMAPGLREVVAKYGSNVDNKETSYAVTKAAQDFLKKFSHHYDEQAFDKYLGAYDNIKTKSFSTRVKMAEQEDAHYQNAVTSSLKQVYIGRFLDLSHCKDILSNTTEQDAINLVNKFDNGQHRYISSSAFLEINNYLASKGLQSDAEKVDYLEQQTFAIGEKQENADNNLKKILAMSDTQKGEILYFDGTTENLAQIRQIENEQKSTLKEKMKEDAQKAHSFASAKVVSSSKHKEQSSSKSGQITSFMLQKSGYSY